MTTVKFPSGVGRAGCPGNGKIILSKAEVSDNGFTGAFPLVRIQWWNSRNKPTAGAYVDLPACDMVELGVALIDEAVKADPRLKGVLLAQLAHLARLTSV